MLSGNGILPRVVTRMPTVHPRDPIEKASCMKKASIIVGKILLFFVGWAILAGMVDIPSSDAAVWRFFAELVPLVALMLFTVVFLLFEKGAVKIPIMENAKKGAISGLITGLVWIGSVVGILMSGGYLAVVGQNQVTYLWLWLASAFLNVVMQELLIRGYMYQLVKTHYSLPTAVTFTTLLFTALHWEAIETGVIPTLNVISMCLFTTALYEAKKTLLAPIMAHAAWNLIGAVVLGCVSLADDYPSLFVSVAYGDTLWSGGSATIEASLATTIVNVVLLLIFFALAAKKQAKK